MLTQTPVNECFGLRCCLILPSIGTFTGYPAGAGASLGLALRVVSYARSGTPAPVCTGCSRSRVRVFARL